MRTSKYMGVIFCGLYGLIILTVVACASGSRVKDQQREEGNSNLGYLVDYVRVKLEASNPADRLFLEDDLRVLSTTYMGDALLAELETYFLNSQTRDRLDIVIEIRTARMSRSPTFLPLFEMPKVLWDQADDMWDRDLIAPLRASPANHVGQQEAWDHPNLRWGAWDGLDELDQITDFIEQKYGVSEQDLARFWLDELEHALIVLPTLRADDPRPFQYGEMLVVQALDGISRVRDPSLVLPRLLDLIAENPFVFTDDFAKLSGRDVGQVDRVFVDLVTQFIPVEWMVVQHDQAVTAEDVLVWWQRVKPPGGGADRCDFVLSALAPQGYDVTPQSLVLRLLATPITDFKTHNLIVRLLTAQSGLVDDVPLLPQRLVFSEALPSAKNNKARFSIYCFYAGFSRVQLVQLFQL